MFKSKLVKGAVVAAAFGFGSLVASADSIVIGQLNVTSKVVLNPGANQQRISQEQVPYIQGDVVNTNSVPANIVFASGAGSMTIAANSTAAVVQDAPAEVLLQNGGVSVNLTDSQSMTFSTPEGQFVVTSDSAISAVAAYENGEFVLVSKKGALTVESENGDVISNVDADNAYTYAGTSAQAVNVQLLGNNSARKTILILLGIGAAILILDDDDDPASPS